MSLLLLCMEIIEKRTGREPVITKVHYNDDHIDYFLSVKDYELALKDKKLSKSNRRLIKEALATSKKWEENMEYRGKLGKLVESRDSQRVLTFVRMDRLFPEKREVWMKLIEMALSERNGFTIGEIERFFHENFQPKALLDDGI